MRAAKCFTFLSFVIFLTMLPASLQAAQGRHQSVGLVLSGGGAKGIAHIGVLDALEEAGIPVDCVTGTSMGAIVGGLYACGYTPAEMMELLLSPYFMSMSKGIYDPEFTYYFGSRPPSPAMFRFPLGRGDSISNRRFDPQSLIAPTPMAFGFMELFSAYTAQCDENFNRLFVPYRCVASDITGRRALVHRSGNLGECIRSSMSFPLVFQPVLMDGNMLVDGGLYCNFPVDVMISDFNPDIIIGVDVSAPDVWPPNSFMDQLSTLVEQPQSYEVPPERGIRLRIDLSRFGLLDFGSAEEIYRIGYEHAITMMDSIRSRVSARTSAEATGEKRRAFKALTPPLRFGHVRVNGASEQQNSYIASFFRPDKGTDTIGIDRARRAFYRVVSSDRLKSLIPQASLPTPQSDLFTLDLSATVKSRYSAAVGGYITSSNNSYLYLSGEYSSLSYRSASAKAAVWIGQSYMAGEVSAELFLPSATPSSLSVRAVASRTRYSENEKYFFRDSEPTFLIAHEYYGKAEWSCALGRTGVFQAGVGGAHLFNSFYRNNDPESYRSGRDHESLDLGMVYAGVEFSTIDRINFPLAGHYWRGRVAMAGGRSRFESGTADAADLSHHRLWAQADWRSLDYFTLGDHFALGFESQAVVSNRPLLENYYGSVSMATAYEPTPASGNVFDTGRRANSFVALGVVPVWKITGALSARVSANVFAPFRSFVMTPGGGVRYSRYFSRLEFFGEADVVYRLPFGDLSAYCNYSSSDTRFNAGVSLGIYFKAPSFL